MLLLTLFVLLFHDDANVPPVNNKMKVNDIKFACSMCSIAVLRYLTDYLPSLDPGVMARLLDTHDVCMSLIPLLEDPPWQRVSNKSGALESYEDGSNGWKEIKGDDRLRVNKHAAQIWLALNNLVVDPECRKKVSQIHSRLRKEKKNLIGQMN